MSGGLRIALAGATGALGQEVCRALEASSLPIAELLLFATETSMGDEIEFRGDLLYVSAELPSLRGMDLLILCTPAEASLDLIRVALRNEVPCIDCSGALRESGDVPLVVTGRSPSSDIMSPVVETPSGVALGWIRVLAALDEAASVVRASGTVLQPATHVGRSGIEVLSSETIAIFSQSEPPESDTFPFRVAFDSMPSPGTWGNTIEVDVSRAFGGSLPVAATCVQVPTFVGEGSVLAVETEKPLSEGDARKLLEKAEGVELWEVDRAPSTRDTSGSDQVLVGPVRNDPSHEGGLLLWIATDGLRLVAAEVVLIAEARLRLN